MTSRFPGPWRIAEFPNGFAVYDATGRQLGFFYGRTSPNTAGQTTFLMTDEARQIAVDFARLPELLNRTSARSEVATFPGGRQIRQARNKSLTPRCTGNFAFISRRPVVSNHGHGLAFG